MRDYEEQLGFELASKMIAPGEPDLEAIREDLGSILSEARLVSATGPWGAKELRYKKIVFFQLVRLLPADESEQLSFDFLGEVERIEALLAA